MQISRQDSNHSTFFLVLSVCQIKTGLKDCLLKGLLSRVSFLYLLSSAASLHIWLLK